MKRIIYILTAIFSAIAAAVYIIEYIADINQYGISFFDIYRYSQIAVMLALGIFSVIQLKKHTPRIILILCGYVFYKAVQTIDYQYLFDLLLLAAALTPAVYELSRYGMAARQEPKAREQLRWPLIAAAALVLGSIAYRVIMSIMQSVRIKYDDYLFYPLNNSFIYFQSGVMGIAALLCAGAFCALMNRRTSALYRMFFTGCILSDALERVLLYHNYIFSDSIPPDSEVRSLFLFFAAIHALFILLILLHVLLTRRGGMLIEQERTGFIGQTGTPVS